MENKLNRLLSDLVVEYHKLQNFHWYIKGKDFFTAHAKLEELYDYINKAVDEVGELILMIEEKPKASLVDFLELSTIKETTTKHITSKEIYKEVLSDFNYLLTLVKEIKNDAETKGIDIVVIQMDDYIKEFTKSIWMINQVVE